MKEIAVGMEHSPSERISLLLKLGKIGTRVQILKDDGELRCDQLFFKSLAQRTLAWSRHKKSMTISPGKVQILPGKLTGLLSVAPSVARIADELCLGVVNKEYVVEIVFQNARDRNIWSTGLELLACGQSLHLTRTSSPSTVSLAQYFIDRDSNNDYNPYTQTHSWFGDDIIEWQEIASEEQRKIRTLYPFIMTSFRGDIFFLQSNSADTASQTHKNGDNNKLKHEQSPSQQEMILRLNKYGDVLLCMDVERENVLMEIPFDSQISVLDHNLHHKESTNGNDNEVSCSSSSSMPSASDQRDHASLSYSLTTTTTTTTTTIYCLSIVRKQQCLRIQCRNAQQYKLWKYGLKYLLNAQYHVLRMRIRRAIIAGDLVLSDTHKQLIESPSRQRTIASPDPKRESLSTSATNRFGAYFDKLRSL